jgi:FtsH-binding integral membrane protein
VILESYITNGLASVVLDAALTTAAITFAAGAYGYTTRRDLSGLGGILSVGLIGVIVASLVGIFVQMPLLYIGISAVSAVQAILLAVSVYLDIFNVFLALLRLFDASGRDD